MASHPTTLEGWTLGYIRSLLDMHVFEDSAFDWKETLDGENGRFRRNAAGMANSGGGFFVFGVADRGATADDRIKGLDPALDVAGKTSDQLSKAPADPGIPFRVGSRLPIPGTSRVLVVAQILSTNAPHSVDGVFHGRAPGNTRALTTQEVTDLVIRREERLAKLNLLLLELKNTGDAAVAVTVSQMAGKAVRGLMETDTRLLAELHADLLPIFKDRPDLSAKLSTLRAAAGSFNLQLGAASRMLGSSANPALNGVLHQLKHFASPVETGCRQLISQLAKEFGLDAPDLRAAELDLQQI